MAHGNSDWVNTIPLVLLGLRTCWREDLQASAADLVYGEQLRVPGEFLHASPVGIDFPDFVSRLKEKMSTLRPVPVAHHSQHKVFVHKDLMSSTHVFLRQDQLRGALQPPYTGPYKVAAKTLKTMDIYVGNKIIKVTLDRVKPAYLAEEGKVNFGDERFQNEKKPYISPPMDVAERPVITGEKPYVTRAGRHVHLRKFYLG